MLFVLTGSSCSGKSTLAAGLIDSDPNGLVIHDFDEAGVPSWADVAWRQRRLEEWVRVALDHQEHGRDMVLSAQSPMGEILAVPSAVRLDGIAVCLVHVTDEVRLRRLTDRDADRWSPEEVRAFLGWAEWHRQHALDPRQQPHVLTVGAWPSMAWHRWDAWDGDDPRWCTALLDTTTQSQQRCLAWLQDWIVRQRDLLSAGTYPLRPGWWQC